MSTYRWHRCGLDEGEVEVYKLYCRVFFSVIMVLLAWDTSFAAGRGRFSIPSVREDAVYSLGQKGHAEKDFAVSMAQQYGWTVRGVRDGGVFELMSIIDERPQYFQTSNVNSGISQGVNLIRNTFPYDLNGAGLTAGVWDAGDVRASHQEFGSRVTVFDSAGNVDHSTHVAGTIGAVGANTDALGMAPSVGIDSYDWNLDMSEIAGRGMSFPDEAGKIYVSNHSYGTVSGWETGNFSGNSGPHWFGDWGDRESDSFGQYSGDASELDSVCYNAPYYLPFWAAGNDRNDAAPSDGTTFYYPDVIWRSKSYDSATDPFDDFFDGGYDTILPASTAKNIMTVGAVNDAVTGGGRDISKATMSSFSSWGPVDDGRIKPDIVCNGVSLLSSTALNNISYGNFSGTSMSTPSAAGAAILLTEYYRELFPGEAMLSSTLKGLIIHTADDLGRAGPDYTFGWGLMNARAGAEQIRIHSEAFGSGKITEGVLDGGNPSDSYSFTWDGVSSIRVTVCWTDPSASSLSGLDNSSSRLINDLDITVTGPGGTVYLPYVLDAANPGNDATTGDNTVDNVEQVYIDLPVVAGEYTVDVGHKGTLVNGQQNYSLLISGQVDILWGALDHFLWDAVTNQVVDSAFDVVVTASDVNGKTVEDFNDLVVLSAVIPGDSSDVLIASEDSPEEYPISVYFNKRRTQVIYLASEIGGGGTIKALGLNVIELPGMVRNDWTIRMKHTSLSVYFSTVWDTDGWTVVYQNDEPPGSLGWYYYQFTTPFEYDGVSNLMVDLSFDNTSFTTPKGQCYKTNTAGYRTIGCQYDPDTYGPPTTWAGNKPAGKVKRKTWFPNVMLTIGDGDVSIGINPLLSDSFVDGVWSGQVSVLESVIGAVLGADDGSGHSGDSNVFDVGSGPVEPNLPGPLDAAVDVALDTILSWTGSSDPGCPTSYDVYFDTSNPPVTIICGDVNDLVCDPALVCSTTYYWQVVAKNCFGEMPGAVWSFGTESLLGDFDLDCSVGGSDLGMLVVKWLGSDVVVDIAPAGGDGKVDVLDFGAFSGKWLMQLTE